MTLDQLKSGGVYFYIADGPFKPANEHYVSACLIAGLGRLGVPIFSNLEIAGATLSELKSMGRHLYVFDITDQTTSSTLMSAITQFASPCKIILSRADQCAGIITPETVPAFMCHENRFRTICGRRLPWAFGLSDAIMTATAAGLPFEQRTPTLIRNFRPSLNQHVRNMLDLSLVGHLEKHFTIDRKISPDHHDRLMRSTGCLAYGGAFDENLSLNDHLVTNDTLRTFYAYITFHQPVTIVRWDSWRWWESLAAGCLTFHLDFEKYGFVLPVMPVAWKHYIPIDLADPKATVERLMDERPRWPEIAAQGRFWARTHYSPEATARRFIYHVTSDDLFT